MVFASCGGAPKDQSLYFSQRALTTGVKAVKAGGIVVLFGEFQQGVGNELYEGTLKKDLHTLLGLKPSDIHLGVQSAYLTAKNLSHCDVILYSEMDPDLVKELHMTPMKGFDQLKELISKRFPEG